MRKLSFITIVFWAVIFGLAWGAGQVWAGPMGPTSEDGGVQTVKELGIEGDTADAFEAWIKAEDPTRDNIVTVPDYIGALPLVISQSSTQTSHGDANATDVTGSSFSIPADWFTAGKALKWTLVGTITGANGAKTVHLCVDGDQVVSLATQAATTGDWKAEFVMAEHTGLANQDCYGELILATGADVEFDYAADTTAMNATVAAKCRVELGSAADTITVEHVRLEHWSQ